MAPGRIRVADDDLAGSHGGESASGGDAEGMHGLANQVFPQHRADRRTAVAAAGERGGAGTLKLDVIPVAIGTDQSSPSRMARPSARLRREVAELMAGIGLGNGLGGFGNSGSGESGNAFLGFEHSWVKAEKAGKVVVDLDQARGADRGGVEAGEKALWQARVQCLSNGMCTVRAGASGCSRAILEHPRVSGSGAGPKCSVARPPKAYTGS